MTLLTSCIVADPPEYTNPVQTRPELSAYGAKPFVYQVVVIQSSLPAPPIFQVPVRSEDAGERLLANLWLDYGSSKPKFLNGLRVPPSTYNITDRFISIPWTVNAADDEGCHSVSLVVAHDSSFPTNPQQLDPVAGDADAAIITWWVNVDPPANELTTLRNCPSAQGTSP